MAKYRKKPVVIDAFQWVKGLQVSDLPTWFIEALKMKKEEEGAVRIIEDGDDKRVKIFTLNGIMTAHYSEYICMGISGELYPCKNDIFEASYEAVEE